MAKKPVTEIGKYTPGSLKFGIIVTVAIFWAQFFRSFVHDVVMPGTPEWLLNFIMAVIISAAGYLILSGYRKIYYRLKKMKV